MKSSKMVAISIPTHIIAATSHHIMNLIVLTAIVAVCGAAKLDRSYLPPASAKTAGGSPGAIQAPFSRSSFNNGLGGLPKGSYENEFQGVVVDAAAAGTRTAETAESGLGAPRISYGSADSKVGAAAFKTRPYNRPGAEATSGNSQFEQSQGFQQGNSQQFSASQGQPGASSQGFQSSQPERPRAALDRTAGILRFENEVGPENYHFAYETDNGITAEENGVATNGVQAQGGFSYTGDDGQVYSVSYTADEKGYQPKGAHLPTPPPIPIEILKSLEQNARDEAAGLKDDGSYDAQKYNAGSDYTESDGANGQFTHQSTKFSGTETDATASSTFIDQSRQPFGRPGQFDKQSSSANVGTSNRFSEHNSFEVDSNSESAGQNQVQGQTNFNKQFSQANTESINRGSTQSSTSSSSVNGFGSFSGNNRINQGNRGGNRNEYLPPLNRPNQNGRPQNGRPQNGKAQNRRPQTQSNLAVDNTKAEETLNLVPLGQQDLQNESRPQGEFTSFGKPIKMQNGFSSFNQNKFTMSQQPNSNFAQAQSQSGFARPNEYLPPGRKPAVQRPQFNGVSNTEQQYNQQSQSFEQSGEKSQETSSDATPITSQSSFNTQGQSTFGNAAQNSFVSQLQQTNTFQKPQSSRPSQNVNRFSTQNRAQFGSSTSQAAPSFGFTQSIKTTAQPDTELTTPFESSNEASSAQPGQSLISNSRPTSRPSSIGGQVNSGFTSQSNYQATTTLGQSPTFPTQPSSEQYKQNSQFGIQAQTSFEQSNDAQFASSTQRPSYYQQPQGTDDSYYYNPPSRPFGSPQGSRFPNAPSDQFITGNQQSSFSQGQSFNSIQEGPRRPFETSNKYPRPPTVTPPTASVEIRNQFQGNQFQQQFQGSQLQQQFQGSTKYPRPPTIAPPSSSSQTQYQANTGVTQSASAFQSQFPTLSTQEQPDAKPSYQSQFSQAQSGSFEQQPTSFQKKPGSNTFTGQSQTFDKQSQEQETTNEETEKPVAFQQYDGEIYEYNKPAQTLPPPDITPVSATSAFAQNVQGHHSSQSHTQFSQTNDENDQRPSQFGLNQSLKPQSGAQKRPQISTTQTQINAQNKPDSKPYGALAQSQNAFGQNSQATRPQMTQFGQNSFGTQSQTDGKLDSRFEQSSEDSSKNQFGFEAACCKQSQVQNKFGQNFLGSQNFRPEPTNFAATAEDFSGPRQPPSFDEQTGYHY